MREKKLRDLQRIAETVKKLAVPGMKPKALIAVVKKHHPDASKKEIAQAAFLSVILSAEFDPEDTQALHDIAVNMRNDPER